MIEDAFLVASEQGLLPEPPQALQGQQIRVKYVSLLAQAQEAASASSMERTMAFVGNLTGVAPDILDNFDTDVAAREYADIMGTSPALVRDIVVRDKIRADRQAAQQQAQQQEQATAAVDVAGKGAQAAKLLSETDSQNPNALTSLLQRGQSRGI
jgi:pyruvate/2-oxoglutarate dehydrogenase complex dihydrolipoamide acyltransferase (E2) component